MRLYEQGWAEQRRRERQYRLAMLLDTVSFLILTAGLIWLLTL